MFKGRRVVAAVMLRGIAAAVFVSGCKSTVPAVSGGDFPSVTKADRGERTTREERRDQDIRPERSERRERSERAQDRADGFQQVAGQPRPAQRPHGSVDAPPGTFDYYLFTLSWSPEFCATHASSPECPTHPGFVVHGLWPENVDGTFPENCSTAAGPANPAASTDMIPTASLVEHEWSTHGTCSGLSVDAYFAQVRSAFRQVKIPEAFSGSQSPAMLPPEAIVAQFAAANPGFPAGSVAISCGNNYLTAVQVCFDKGLHAEACQGLRSCRANAVKITPRGGS